MSFMHQSVAWRVDDVEAYAWACVELSIVQILVIVAISGVRVPTTIGLGFDGN